MGVEPTRDRAERPLSRFEDGETHRGPYTSIGTAPSDPSAVLKTVRPTGAPTPPYVMYGVLCHP